MTFVLDCSHYQGTINWPAVADSSCGGVYVKVTDGAAGVDADWQTNHAGARAAGIPVGCYHFAEGGIPATEAAHFASVWSAGWDLVPVLDYEIMSANAAWLATFRSAYRAATGRQAFRVYSSYSLLTGALNPSGWLDADTTIWIARYAASLDWSNPAAVLWQNEDSATVPGILGGVDEDQFLNGWTPEADMTQPADVWGYQLANPANSTTYTAGQYLTYANEYAGQAAQSVAQAVVQLTAIQGSLTAEQSAVLAAISQAEAVITAGQTPAVSAAQLASLTSALESALPSYTVSIAPKAA